jgi:hypothetical protein
MDAALECLLLRKRICRNLPSAHARVGMILLLVVPHHLGLVPGSTKYVRLPAQQRCFVGCLVVCRSLPYRQVRSDAEGLGKGSEERGNVALIKQLTLYGVDRHWTDTGCVVCV